MKTKVYILALGLSAVWWIGGTGPDSLLARDRGDPPAAADDKPRPADDDEDAPMAGPKNADHRRPPRDRSPEDEDFDRPRRGRRGDGGERRGFRRPDREDGPMRGRRERMRRDEDMRISAEEEAKVLGILEQQLPDLHGRLVKRREENPEAFKWAMRKIMPMMREFMDLQQDHPEMANVVIEEFKLEREVRSLLHDYKEAREAKDDTAVQNLENQFRDLMTRRHELQMQRRRFRLEDFRKRLERERQRLEDEEAELGKEDERFAEDLQRRVESLRKGRIRDAVGPPHGERRHGKRFDGPPHRGDRRPGFDGPPRRERGRRSADGPPPRRGPNGEGPPPRDRDDGEPDRPEDDLDI